MALKNKTNDAFIKNCESIGITPCNVSRQNKKLVPNETTAFIIWNLPSIKTCPFATEHCKASCYARKAEKAYPNCLPSRERNFAESLKDDFVIRMAYTILKIRKGTRKQNVIVRIHESGDFYNKTYAEKWMRIIEMCKGENITFIAYTKSFPYFDGATLAIYDGRNAIPESLNDADVICISCDIVNGKYAVVYTVDAE